MVIWQRKNDLPLALRLFLSHIFVMVVAVSSLVLVSRISSHNLFSLHLEKLEKKGHKIDPIREHLIEGFENAWTYGTLGATLVGATVAGGLSYWAACRIIRPLTKLEEVTQNFASGKLDERLPRSEIPELNRLSTSFNRMAASLEGVEQRRTELIGDLTHELRTPLTVIYTYLEGITANQIEPSQEIYERLMRETKRLQRLIDDLQQLSKAEAGYLPINLASIEVYPLLSSLVTKFSEQILEDNLVIHLECSPSLPAILADIDRLEQVLINLLGNALTYTEMGSITLKAWTQKRQIWLAVIDTGTGIASEDLPHIFDRFWRSGSARERNYRGSGLGLAISRRLIELQGGKIEVESELGKGSTFRFCLPQA